MSKAALGTKMGAKMAFMPATQALMAGVGESMWRDTWGTCQDVAEAILESLAATMACFRQY